MLKKNIIWFQIDSLRPEFLNYDNDANTKKIFLDELVRKGDFFTNCIASAPYTIASEVSIFTGLYPHVHGVDGWFKTSPESIKSNVITFTDVLKAEDYYTTCIYESAVRAYVPPYSFDEYHMLEPGIDFPLEKFGKHLSPKFLFCQFSGIHDDCIRLKGNYTKAEYRKSVEKVSDQIESIYNKYCSESDIIVIASDHGVRCIDEPEGDHQEYVTGRYLTDKTIKACFSIHAGNNTNNPAKHDELVRTIDIAPTILDFAELKPLCAQGISLKNLFGKKSTFDKINLPEYVISQTGGMLTSPWKPDTWCVRTETWKYIFTKVRSKGAVSFKKELYYMPDDEFELNNVYKFNVDIAKAMHNILKKEIFKSNISIEQLYAKNNIDYSSILKSRTYPIRLRIKITLKNILYKHFSRTKVRLNLILKKYYFK
ncbi:sulfatase-like hydrolase/transferase [Gammaproteobacteria bacterium]|nr:sulfatase-like hydrolase/transferase [Gammaproteobacteria bacterium]